MADAQSVGQREPSRKDITIQELADFIILTYKPQDGPVVIYWREMMNEFRLSKWPDYPVKEKDDWGVHQDLLTYMPGLRRALKSMTYGLRIISINRNARKKLDHRDAPDRDKQENRRSDTFYRSCIPHSHAPAFGMVLFPRNSQEDHPLIKCSLERRGQDTANRAKSWGVDMDEASGNGQISDPVYEEISEQARKIITEAVADRHPLFKKVSSNGEQTAEPPPR